jgi:hypothetical protein
MRKDTRELDLQIRRALCNIAALAATLLIIESVAIIPVRQQGNQLWA